MSWRPGASMGGGHAWALTDARLDAPSANIIESTVVVANAAHGAGKAAVVGPNAVTQLSAALVAHGGHQLAAEVFEAAGFRHLLASPPAQMVREDIPATLFKTLAASHADADAILADAGRRTADYVLAHRIPAPVRTMLPLLPRRIASRFLVNAVKRNAWTFVGSGTFRAVHGRPATVEIANNPLATPGCPWHAAVFTRLFGALVSPDSRVINTASCATGAPRCAFTVNY